MRPQSFFDLHSMRFPVSYPGLPVPPQLLTGNLLISGLQLITIKVDLFITPLAEVIDVHTKPMSYKTVQTLKDEDFKRSTGAGEIFLKKAGVLEAGRYDIDRPPKMSWQTISSIIVIYAFILQRKLPGHIRRQDDVTLRHLGEGPSTFPMPLDEQVDALGTALNFLKP